MLDIWDLVLIMDALHLHTKGNNLAMSSSYCRTLSAQHQMIVASQIFLWIDTEGQDLLGMFWKAQKLRAVCGPCVFAQENKQMLWIHPLPCEMPHFCSFPLPQHPNSTTDTLLSIFITSMQSVLIFPIFLLAFNIMGLCFTQWYSTFRLHIN